jgi:DNA-binding transcriptional LysR family regulator
MDIGDLKTFLAVVEESHFSNAAKKLNISLGLVSQRIRRMEVQLGVVLFSRTTRSVVVTLAGQELFEEGKKIIAKIARLEDHIRKLAAGQAGTLRLGVVSSLSYTLLPKITQIVEERMPSVKLKISAGLFTSAQEVALEEKSLDAGLLRLPVRKSGLAYSIVAVEPLVLVIAASHPLAGRERINVKELQQEAFITYPHASGSVVREAQMRVCEKNGFSPRGLVEVSETSALIGLVASGIGVALVPQSARNLTRSGVKFINLDANEPMEIALAWRAADTSAMLQQFLETLRQSGRFVTPIQLTEEYHENNED